jgi:hypothetical protein
MGKNPKHSTPSVKDRVPDISYIVSAYNRPDLLPGLLWSLAAQSHKNFEVIVTDNAKVLSVAKQHDRAVNYIRSINPFFKERFHYKRTHGQIDVSTCYHSAEWAIKHIACGLWYCFPCDDSYYAPEFGQRMLRAGYSNGWDFVVCKSVVVGPAASGGSGYRVWDMAIGRTVKTSFIVKASVFPGFTLPVVESAAGCDYQFGHDLVHSGVPWGHVDEVMIVHN